MKEVTLTDRQYDLLVRRQKERSKTMTALCTLDLALLLIVLLGTSIHPLIMTALLLASAGIGYKSWQAQKEYDLTEAILNRAEIEERHDEV